MDLAVVVIVLGITAFAIYPKESPVVRALLWLVSTMTWLFFAFYMYNAVSSVNTYLPTAIAVVGLSMALVSTVMVIIPLFGISRPKSRSDLYEEQKQSDKKRLLRTVRRGERNPWNEQNYE